MPASIQHNSSFLWALVFIFKPVHCTFIASGHLCCPLKVWYIAGFTVSLDGIIQQVWPESMVHVFNFSEETSYTQYQFIFCSPLICVAGVPHGLYHPWSFRNICIPFQLNVDEKQGMMESLVLVTKTDSFLLTFSGGYRLLNGPLKTHELYNPDMAQPTPILGKLFETYSIKGNKTAWWINLLLSPRAHFILPICFLLLKRVKEKAGISTSPLDLFLLCKKMVLAGLGLEEKKPAVL